jgi:hypothetical protein
MIIILVGRRRRKYTVLLTCIMLFCGNRKFYHDSRINSNLSTCTLWDIDGGRSYRFCLGETPCRFQKSDPNLVLPRLPNVFTSMSSSMT